MSTFSIAIPQTVPDTGFDGPHLQAFLRRAEELGFEGAWTVESVIGTVPDLAPLETLSYAAACTERIRLGCAVLVSSLTSPLHLAKSIASVDHSATGGWRSAWAPAEGSASSRRSASTGPASSPGSTRA